MFEIRPVDPQAAEAVESLGSKRKFWFRKNGQRFLFKAEDRGTGEDWAEVVVCQLCGLLGIPHVEYELASELAVEGERRGVICPNIAEPPTSLVLGNELLLGNDRTYPSQSRKRVQQHTIGAIVDVLRRLEPPLIEGSSLPPDSVRSAGDVFVGYLLLDAWVANQDRHHENWGALRDDMLRLAPTFDHGASLARNLSDEERSDRLNTRDRGYGIEAFAARARSALYASDDGTSPLTTHEAFVQFASNYPEAAEGWLSCLEGLAEQKVNEVVEGVPGSRMSDICKKFTLELLACNRRRLVCMK